MRKIYLLIGLLISILPSVFAQNDWVKTISEKSKISFDLPENPMMQTKDLNGIKIEVFSYKDAATVFGVVASDFSGVGLDFTYSDPTEYYQEMKEGSLVTGNAILILESSVPYQKMLGKEIIYTQLVGEHEYTYYKRFFFRGKFIYQIAIGGPSRMKQFLVDKKDLFFNTIDFKD
ncbi:hypothetical protein BZG02_12185 [Labilibaculum filiforme]|uniref:Uncharacterized protein n=1 Tax=Labilibaculum filiforme TaxID=1940526 RepID=A0A2N3HWM9_9BACT|nr:hypothetical protein [Labilibaculum filiforme]PKQ62480.1 hypothetical protein BZG02_12185 [Labilibaculum filiforme]